MILLFYLYSLLLKPLLLFSSAYFCPPDYFNLLAILPAAYSAKVPTSSAVTTQAKPLKRANLDAWTKYHTSPATANVGINARTNATFCFPDALLISILPFFLLPFIAIKIFLLLMRVPKFGTFRYKKRAAVSATLPVDRYSIVSSAGASAYRSLLR